MFVMRLIFMKFDYIIHVHWHINSIMRKMVRELLASTVTCKINRQHTSVKLRLSCSVLFSFSA